MYSAQGGGYNDQGGPFDRILDILYFEERDRERITPP